MNLHQLKSQYIAGIYQTKALHIREEAFTLQSGKKSHLYLNHRNFLAESIHLSLIAKIYHELSKSISPDFNLGAVDSIMSPIIVGAMSVMFGYDYVVIKQLPLKHGTKECIYGNIKKEILLIDDMTSTGETLIDSAEKIRAHGGSVSHAIISAYRDDAALKNLKKNNINPISIASFQEIIDQLNPMLSSRETEIINTYPLIID